MQSDHSIHFFSYEDESQNPIFVMPAPYMFDSANNYSTEIDVSLTGNENGYKLIYTPSFDWLTSEKITYPIFIDPTITTSTSAANIYDAYVQTGSGTNFGSGTTVQVGNNISNDYYRTFVKIQTLPTLDPGSIVTSAKLFMMQTESATGTFRTSIH